MVLIPDGYGQVNLQFTGSGAPRTAEVTFGVEHGGLDPLAIAERVESALTNSQVANSFGTSTTISNIHVKVGPDATGAFIDLPVNIVGLTQPPQGPPNVAILIRKVTLMGGRRGRGRMFIPGTAESVVDQSGQLTESYRAQIELYWNGFLGELNEGLIFMSLLHGPETQWVLNEDGQPRREPIPGVVPLPTVVTALVVDTHVATQRRRLRD